MSYWDWLPLEIQGEVLFWEKKLKMNEVIRELEAQQNHLEKLAKKSKRWDRAIRNYMGSHTVAIGNKVIRYTDIYSDLQPHEIDFWNKNLYSTAYRFSGPKECEGLYECKWIDHDGEFFKNNKKPVRWYPSPTFYDTGIDEVAYRIVKDCLEKNKVLNN